jgi:DNA polymerase III alpha subunit
VRPQVLWSWLLRQGEAELFPRTSRLPADYPEEQKLLDELRILGLMVSRHPVSVFRPQAQARVRLLGWPPLIPSSRIPRCSGREVSLVGLVASGKEVATARSTMVFVTLEDEFSLFESVLFPAVFRRFRRCIDGGGVLLIRGRIRREMGCCSVTVLEVSRPGSEGHNADA